MIERQRPERRPFIPRRAMWITLAALTAVVAIAVAATFVNIRSSIEVPAVVGLEENVAIVRLAQSGLDYDVVTRPFDTAEEGTVLSQSPEPGERIEEDEAVELVISAGTEEFTMPDVVGLSFRVAQAQLEQGGLVVRIDTMPSDSPIDTVIMTNPSPGATVRTSDIVRLTVSAEGTATTALLPYALSGDLFVIDPSAVTSGSVDAPLEVARRLQSLLEASGATVRLTRSAASVDVSPAGRVSALAGPTATAVVGIDAPATGPGGRSVVTLTEEVAPSTHVDSRSLADLIVREVSASGTTVGSSTITADPVLTAAGAPGVRVRLGSFAVAEDVSVFRDPAWADTVARSLYRAIGERYEGL